MASLGMGEGYNGWGPGSRPPGTPMRRAGTRLFDFPVGTHRASAHSVSPKTVCLAVVLATPGCVLVAPFDSSLMEVDETETAGHRSPGIGGGDELADAGPGSEPVGDPDGGAASGWHAGGDGRDAGADEDAGAGAPCAPGDVRDCYPGPEHELGTGICRGGTQSCDAPAGNGGPAWGHCVGAVTAVVEACGNGLDDDCDGSADEDCALPETVWCWFCSGINLFTDNAMCAIGAVPANDDGSCPDGSSLEVPECEPCRVCSVIQGFCENPECCGDWQGSQTVGAGCSCWACPGQGEATTADAAIVEAEQAGLAFCELMPPEYDSACGDYMNGCYVSGCGSAASCE